MKVTPQRICKQGDYFVRACLETTCINLTHDVVTVTFVW